MADLQEFEVRLSSGQKGTVLRTSRFLDKREFNTVKLSNGTELTVPSGALKPQQDGSFYLQDGQTDIAGQREKSSRASDADSSRADKFQIDGSLFKEDIDVQRIPVNRVLDRPAEIRIVKKRTMQDAQIISLGNDRGDVNSRREPEG